MGSGAIEDDFAIAWDLRLSIPEFVDVDHAGAGNPMGRQLELQRVPEVEDRNRRAFVEQLLQLVGLDPGSAKRTQETPTISRLSPPPARRRWRARRRQTERRSRRSHSRGVRRCV